MLYSVLVACCLPDIVCNCWFIIQNFFNLKSWIENFQFYQIQLLSCSRIEVKWFNSKLKSLLNQKLKKYSELKSQILHPWQQSSYWNIYYPFNFSYFNAAVVISIRKCYKVMKLLTPKGSSMKEKSCKLATAAKVYFLCFEWDLKWP